MVQFLFELEAYFNKVCRDVNLKKAYEAQLQQKKGDMTASWDLNEVFEKEVDKLEN